MDQVKANLLIGDPDPDIRQTLKLYFENHGLAVELVTQAGDVLKAARVSQPHLILVSTEFEDQDPYDVCQTLLDDRLTSHIPVIMLLHVNQRNARIRALEAGVDDVIAKPLDIEELRLRVEATIRFSTVRMRSNAA